MSENKGEKQCPICGEPLFKPRRNQIYCSKPCRRKARVNQSRNLWKSEQRVCAYKGCNNVFQPKRRKHFYCSQSCCAKARQGTTRKQENHVDKTCTWCKGTYHSPSKQSRFCCNDCIRYFANKKSKVMTHYMFEGYSQARVAREISKLYKLGKNYRIKE